MSSMPAIPSILICLLIVCVAPLLQHPAAAQTKTPVSIELVLAVDTSLSVDEFEYDLQMTGIANAFRSPEIIALIQQHEGVAVALFQWSSRVDKRFVIPWHLLRSPASVLSFAEKVEYAARDPVRRFTAIGGAIDLGIRMIAENNYEGLRLKIDISGDGRNNTGITPAATWLDAQAQGIVINGLPILVDTFNLDAYFREKVIHGPGAFIEIAMDYNDFAKAFYRKLKRELSPMISENNFAPGVLGGPRHFGLLGKH